MFGLKVLPVQRDVLLDWETALYGAIIMGWGVTLVLAGRHAFQKKDKELMKILLIGISVWLLVEAFFSTYCLVQRRRGCGRFSAIRRAAGKRYTSTKLEFPVMNARQLLAQRLSTQKLSTEKFNSPEAAVSALGAVQAQDYYAALWALGLRLQNATEAGVQNAFNEGKFLRIHVLRPTWHFVSPKDIGWMLDLTAARIKRSSSTQWRTVGLTESIFKKSRKVIDKALKKGEPISRQELGKELEKRGLPLGEGRLPHYLMRAELDQVICSGPRVGKNSTYMLFDQRAASSRRKSRDEALAELARRFFSSHGPATLRDFVWWSGLNTSEAKSGLEAIKKSLTEEKLEGEVFWMAGKLVGSAPHSVLLVQNYDEFVIAYAGRSAIFDDSHLENRNSRQNPIFNHSILVNGELVGNWVRVIKGNTVNIRLKLIQQLSRRDLSAIHAQAKRYAEFLRLKPIVSSAE